jgi:hypothetical protein
MIQIAREMALQQAPNRKNGLNPIENSAGGGRSPIQFVGHPVGNRGRCAHIAAHREGRCQIQLGGSLAGKESFDASSTL